MAEIHLPSTLRPLFRDLPRRLDVEAATVADALDELDRRWPGLRDRLCEPGTAPLLRRHIHVYVDGERGDLSTAVAERSRLDVIAAISGG
jgi:sulfur-carrier protein